MTCASCRGLGVVPVVQQLSEDTDRLSDDDETCEDCQGTGEILCLWCDCQAWREVRDMYRPGDLNGVCVRCDAIEEQFSATTAILLLAAKLGPVATERRKAA